MRTWNLWLRYLLFTSLTVLIAYLWLDRPISLFVHDTFHHRSHEISVALTQLPDPLIGIANIIFVVIGLLALFGRALSKHERAAFISSMSVIFAASIKNQLKFLLGRTWPETWIKNNPSFIHDRVYGFNFMHGGAGYESFPSGHMAVTCAVISVLWIYYPQLRWAYVIVGLAVALGLIGADFHFLSDVIAGSFIGISTAWMSMAILSATNTNNRPAARSK
jgi:membrane-associated phospholipid phosphatase